MPIRVAIVDDQALIRSGLQAFLAAASDLTLVGEAANGEEAVQLCELVEPDVVLMDWKMPVLDGISAARQIHERWPDILVVILTNYVERGMAQSILDAGASGYLLKDITPEELHTSLRRLISERRLPGPRLVTSVDKAESLDELAQTIITESSDSSRLAALLRRRLPLILPGCQIEVRIVSDLGGHGQPRFPNRELFTFPAESNLRLPDEGWRWLSAQSSLRVAHAGAPLPWNETHTCRTSVILAPILAENNMQPIGGLAIWPEDAADEIGCLLPLAESVANELRRGIIAVNQNLANQRQAGASERRKNLTQELLAAARIQADLLPARMPRLPGWNFAARLEPAYETSGDFYDLIPLANNHLGLAIADVSDKGMGAALFMALSSTLLRTYAVQYPTLPALSISTVNERILNDTRSNMFVTAFYSVLEPNSGRLRYVNAGHNPPLLISGQRTRSVERLRATGMALGVLGDMIWKQKVARLQAGDILFMYTDGLTDAQDPYGQFYDEQRLVNLLRRSSRSADEVLQTVLEDLERFTHGAPRLDDVTILVVHRTA